MIMFAWLLLGLWAVIVIVVNVRNWLYRRNQEIKLNLTMSEPVERGDTRQAQK
jgi:hypothetical protein